MSVSKCLTPPFSRNKGLVSKDSSIPPTFRRDSRVYHTAADVEGFLQRELLTPKLDQIHQHLWLAGLPRAARPLHRQKLLGRDIYVTEIPDEHLVWHGTKLFVKSLPMCLLDYDFWVTELDVREDLHRSACGLLVSYIWLINNKNDFNVALQSGLLPDTLRWETWAALVPDILDHIDTHSLTEIDRRYIYGELRLSRLSSLYRFGAAGFSTFNLVHGFMTSSERYNTFFERNFGWVLAFFLHVTVVLSALQVALATDRLQSNGPFQAFSYGITILSLGLVAAASGLMLLVWLGLFMFHLLSTIQYCKKVASERHRASE